MTFETFVTMDQHIQGIRRLESLGINLLQHDIDDVKAMVEQVVAFEDWDWQTRNNDVPEWFRDPVEIEFIA